MSKQINEKIIRQKPTWILKNMKKALSGPVASFVNTEQDEKRLKLVEKELQNRRG